jgi:group I intron endonuclease
LKQAGVSTGFKHSEETIKHLQDLHSGENHPRYGVTPTEAQRKATSIALKDYYAQHVHHNKGKKATLASQYGIGGKRVHLYGDDGTYLNFPSVNGARQYFKVRFMTISSAIDSGQKVLLHGKYWEITSYPR